MIVRLIQQLSAPFRRHPFAADVTLGVVLFILALALNDVGYETGPPYPWAVLPRYSVAVAALALTMLPIIIRRRYPLSALVSGVSGLVATRLLHVPEYQLSSIVLFFYLYSAGRWGSAELRDAARLVASVAVLIVLGLGINEERQFLSLGLLSTRTYVLASIVGILGNLVFIIAPWVLGNVARSRAEREADLAAANQALVASRAAAERQAVTAERVRIARELHDVVAHHVSVMGVQAGAARRLVTTSPETASDALADIEESSRQAVAELHRLLGFLRSPEADTAPPGVVETPAPGLDQLESLRRKTAAAGLAVSLTVNGDRPATVPASIDLSAYRIVQEGLTNALKHSGQQQADVVVDYRPRSLLVRISNGGAIGRFPPTASPGGNGLVGMKERVALHGGRLDFGPSPNGGFVVEAELPFDRGPVQPTVGHSEEKTTAEPMS